ncbi:SAM-dependent methyltransferase [Desulfonema limicola]|uniref:SAM-dependent methyltransferase n=2 Tax=Desulfonema limicola TaxID=45656 RepID=A0A975BEI0_9BACT|nr:SAM-dependent methyltransferase [Desulfonema limicola]
MILEESARLGRSLNCAEIGIDKGQMLYFMRDAGFGGIQSWVGIDIEIKAEAEKAGYTELIKSNVESSDFVLGEKFDVIILLHVLEHLYEPEKLLEKTVSKLKQGGIIIGGFPIMPHFLIRYWQKRLRIILGKNGHVSAFSPHRVSKMAKNCGLNLEFISGAFLCRNSGGLLEQSRLWMRFNLLYGALFFKSLGSEVYFLMRKDNRM